jgi:hypothetical protein
MQSAGVEAANFVLSMEEMRHEENKRVNADRELLRALAPDGWRELTEAFIEACAKLTATSHRLQFHCDAPDPHTFNVYRMVGEISVKALAFTFDPRVPRIVYEKVWGKSSYGSLDLAVTGNQVLFASGNSGVVLSTFVSRMMLMIAR